MGEASTKRRFDDWREVPRDLRTAEDLLARGYHDLGPVAGQLRTDGTLVDLYSTSEARLRRDGMWARRSATQSRATGSVRPTGGDVVRRLASGTVAPPGQPVRGHCERCGDVGFGILDGVCSACRRLERDASVRRTAGAWIERLFDGDFVVIDTETTGLGRRDEIIEIAVVDGSGTTLFESLVYPFSQRIPAEATRVHGLTLEHLAGAPTWPSVVETVVELTAGKRVLAWNAPFDERMTRQSSRAWRLKHALPAFECAMRACAMARGIASGRLKLATAAADLALLGQPQSHRSADDARLTFAVLRRAAGLDG